MALERDDVVRRLVASGSVRRQSANAGAARTAACRRGHQHGQRGVGRLHPRARPQRAGVPASRHRRAGAGRVGGRHGVVRLCARLTRHDDLDVVVVIRGGGSKTELATFDHESIATAIATSPLPVFTGLGHEIDRSVADEVAHSSLKTPTACAAALVEHVQCVPSTQVEQVWSADRSARQSGVARGQHIAGHDRPRHSSSHGVGRANAATIGSATAANVCGAVADRALERSCRSTRSRHSASLRSGAGASRTRRCATSTPLPLGSDRSIRCTRWPVVGASPARPTARIVRDAADTCAGRHHHHNIRERQRPQPRRGDLHMTEPSRPAMPLPSPSWRRSSASSSGPMSMSTCSPTQVKRAAELIGFCRDRIGNARLHIEQVVADLGDDTP